MRCEGLSGLSLIQLLQYCPRQSSFLMPKGNQVLANQKQSRLSNPSPSQCCIMVLCKLALVSVSGLSSFCSTSAFSLVDSIFLWCFSLHLYLLLFWGAWQKHHLYYHYQFLRGFCPPFPLCWSLNFQFSSSPSCCLIPLVTVELLCRTSWPGVASHERFAARALFQWCLMLHPCCPWALNISCPANGEKKGMVRRLRRKVRGNCEEKLSRDKWQ